MTGLWHVVAVLGGACVGPVAWAAPPSAVVEVDPVGARDHLAGVTSELIALHGALAQAWDGVSRGPVDAGAWRTAVLGRIDEAAARLSATPPWQGDASLRDGALVLLSALRGEVDRALTAAAGIVGAARVTSADLDALEATYAAYRVRMDEVDTAFGAVQQDFGARHGLDVALVALTPSTDADAFVFPAIVPAGARVGAAVRAGFALRYHNQLVVAFNDGVTAISAFFAGAGARSPTVEADRAAAVAAIRASQAQVRELGPWQGDAALVDATDRALGALIAALEGPGVAYAQLRGAPSVTVAEAARQREVADALNRAVPEASGAWADAQAAFQARWGLTAYAAWRAARSSSAGAQPVEQPP